MTKKQRTEQILNNLDVSVSYGRRHLDAIEAELADPDISDFRRRQMEASRDVISGQVAEEAELAQALRNGEIDCYDDVFGGRRQ